MLIIPAIDLKDGQCVRLKQGEMDSATVFSSNPADMAGKWLASGARRLHLVDLNGAFAGHPKNEAAIRKILKEVGSEIDVQLGGGIRDLDTIERYLDAGLRYVYTPQMVVDGRSEAIGTERATVERRTWLHVAIIESWRLAYAS